MILVITNKQDITADLVILRLQERGIDYVRLNTEDFPEQIGVSWSLEPTRWQGILLSTSKCVNLGSVSSVWYRRPLLPRPSSSIVDPAARSFAVQESDACLRNLWALLGCFWVSRPDHIRLADHKLLNLRTASELGFETPRTLLTTNPEEALSFCQVHERTIAKPLGRGFVGDGASATVIIYTNLLSRSDRDRLSAVSLAPTLFQSYVPKLFDLRVTVVGRRIFATEIHSANGSNAEPSVDWRRTDTEELPHRPHVLPDAIADRVLALVHGFGLQFAALDFVVSPDGRYVFLEINPNGQWAWIEQLIGTPISYAIADLLSGQGEPL